MNRGFWKGMLISCFIMLLVLVGSYPFLEPGSSTYIILQLAAIHLVVAMLLIGSLLHFEWSPFSSFE